MATKISKISSPASTVSINAKCNWKSYTPIPLMSSPILLNLSKDYVLSLSITNIPSSSNWELYLSADHTNSTSQPHPVLRDNAQGSNRIYQWAYRLPITTIERRPIPIFTNRSCLASIISSSFARQWCNCNLPLSTILYSLSCYWDTSASMIPLTGWWETWIGSITTSWIFLRSCKVKILNPISTRLIYWSLPMLMFRAILPLEWFC